MDPLTPRFPPHYETRSIAEGDTQPNDGCCKGLRIKVNRILRSARLFFASRINGTAQNPSGGPRLRLSSSDKAAPAASASQFTSSAPSQCEQDAANQRALQIAFFEKKEADAIREARKHCGPGELQKKPPPPEREAPFQTEISAYAPSIDAVQCEKDKKEKRALAFALFNERAPAFDLFIQKLGITILTAREQAVSALKLSFHEQKEMRHLKGAAFLKVVMSQREMIKDARKIFDDFQDRFPKYGMPCKETDIDQVMWLTLHSMNFKSEGDAVHPPPFEKIIQDARNNIPELQLLNIVGKEIGTQPGNVSREEINRQYRTCFQAARNKALAAIREQNPAILRRLDDKQFEMAENFKNDFSNECDRLSSTTDDQEDFVPAVLAQAHKNVKIRVALGNEETLRRIDEMLAASITPTMLLAKMSSAVAVAPLLLEVAPINTPPSTPKSKPYSDLVNRPRS